MDDPSWRHLPRQAPSGDAASGGVGTGGDAVNGRVPVNGHWTQEATTAARTGATGSLSVYETHLGAAAD